MKLQIKKEFFDRIEKGDKIVDYRDAHITFVCIETGEELTRNVIRAPVLSRSFLPDELKEDNAMFTDDKQIHFRLE